ncbi:uncharacterized protein LOC143084161 [Mytilus galloprovincialis]|uniref:uncharacterized protein LOC143084161 n=1 Tax=Mytilus galloprovincialis TaxID=29158 RepID=UPI003F7CC557
MDQPGSVVWTFWFLCLFMVYRPVNTNFIKFRPFYEYQYNFQSDSDVKDLGKFKVDAKISYTNIEETGAYQEILLKVYTFTFKANHESGTSGHDMDLSKWFSFEITPHGEILNVYHPKEDGEVLATKKGFAALLASKLHGKQQILGNKRGNQWVYHTKEIGNEGPHNATYTVVDTATGIEFRKVRLGHPFVNSKSTFQKTLHFHHELGTIHKILIEEHFKGPTTQSNFDPNYNMRKVKAVNEFSSTAYPEMSAISNGKLEFLTRHRATDLLDKPITELINGTIHVQQFKRKKPKVPVMQLWQDLKSNVTCIREEPEEGSPIASYCFLKSLEIMKLLPDEEIVKVADFYFIQLKPLLMRNKEATEIMVDVFGALGTDLTQNLLVEKILRADRANPTLIVRLMTHIVGMDEPPVENITTAMEDICFKPEKFHSYMYEGDLHNRVLLALGSVAHKLSKAGQTDKATEIINRVHSMIGLHDPWLYRQRRSSQSRVQKMEYDRYRAVLLETLGNARIDHSYDYIISHINTTNSPWIKRAGVHALRKYNHHMAANVLLTTALYDDDENVRYEALLMYQAHPKSVLLNPLNVRNDSNETSVIDPYASDMHFVAVNQRAKRGFFDGLHFRLQAPGVDWRKLLGSEDVGASFGIIIENYLDLKIAPLSGHVKVNVHDEAYARIHLGIVNKNLDFFLARLCFKGGTKYNLNILQENEMKKVGNMAKGFDGAIKGIVGGIKDGIDLFKQIISGKLSFKKMITDFVDALEDLPKTVVKLRETAIEVIKALGRIDERDLPPFIRPVKRLVMHVTKLFNDIKSDVMTFYNTLEETITVIIPKSATDVYEAIKEVIHAFSIMIKDPKTAITQIGKGALTIYTSVMSLIDAVNKTREACFFLKDDKPYWFDIPHQFEIVKGMSKAAFDAIAHHSGDWVKEEIQEDVDNIAAFTKGRLSTTALRKEITQNITKLVHDLLEPFQPLIGFIDPFLKLYNTVFGTIKNVKKAYDILKEGYQFARSIIDRLFGPRAHKEFPRDTRLSGNGCSGEGFYPSKKNRGSEYWSKGVDLEIDYHEDIVAPFPGYITRTNRDDEVVIKATGGSLQDVNIYITNIHPEGVDHPSDENDKGKLVSAGVKIGTATHSGCMNHIHVAFEKGEEGFIDPTRFFEGRPFSVPVWDQKCDDYKLVWKFETIAEGCILCLGEEDPAEDTSPEITSTVDQPSDLSSSDNPGSDVSSIKSDPGGMYNKFESSGVRKKRSLFGGSDKKNPFMTLLHKANTFFKKFSIKRLKMGTIINFLHKLKMTDSMNKMADVMKTIKKIIDNKPCFNPAQATDDQLVQELMERGKPFTGTRDQMIKRLTQADNQCPLLSFTMPENLVCTFDPMCMGVECCINVKLFMFLHTVKAYARFDPCQMEFHYGIDDWHNSIKLDIHIDGLKKDIRSGIKMNILGGIEIILRLEIQKTDSEAFANVGLGFCDQSDTSNCVVYVDLLKDAILPLPICHPDGSFEWPKIDWSKFFSKEAVLERLKNAGKSAAKQITQAAAGEILNALGLPKNLLLSTGPCPRPGKMTKGQLTEELKQRGLVVTGTDDERIQRLEDDDRRCKLFGKDHNLLPEITNEFLKDHLYYSVSSNCLRIDACTDFSIDLGANIPAYTKAFRAFIDVDFCKFILSFGFEGWKETLVLISYDWGTERNIPISKDIQIKLNIDKDDDRKMFIIDFGLKIVVGEKPLIDQYLLTKQEIPIPICNENFTLPGGGSFAGFLTALGGKLTGQAFDLVIKEMGLETTFKKIHFSIPEGPKDCPVDINPQKYLPAAIRNMLRCEMPQNCFGLNCGLDLSFKLPFGDFHVSYNIPFWFKMSPCDFDIDIKFGPFQHKTVLLNYDWGTPDVLTIGKGDKPPITINYSIDKMGDGQGFIVDVKITICFPLGDDPFCIPEHGLHMLQHQEIPACSKNFTDMMKNFSVSEIAKDFGLELKAGLKEGAVQFILERLGLEEFFSGPKCDKRRPPYSPAVQGWNNECPLSIFNLPNIEEMMSCHFTETCTGIECCVEIPYLGLTLHPFFLLDPCQYTLSFGINTINNTFSLFEYEWGKKEKISLADGVIQLEFTIKKPPEQKKFVIDLNVKTCLEEGKPCEVDEAIFQGTEVPQPMCDMEATMSLKNFSLTDWASQVGAEIAGQLQGKFVKILLQQLGLDVMLKKPSCDLQSEMYSPAVKGWKSECPKPLSLPDLPSALTCYVPDYCTGIDCCYHFDYLDLSLNIYLYIDTCNYVIKGGIEKFTFELPFFHYNWGEEKEERLQEVIRIKYKINKLSEQKKFIVDLEFSICLEKDKCATKLPLFTKQLIPQPFCDMNMNFSITDVSLSEWMKDKGLQLGQSLSTALANRLLDELGLSPFMNEEQCDRYTGVFAGTVDGWNSQDCPLNMTLPKIHSSVSCYIPDYCTGISCCIEVGKIGKSFSTYALMDACNWKLSVGIEKRSFNISLSNYEWGKKEVFSLLNVIRLEFTIHDLNAEKKYMLNMNMSVCLEQDGACLVSVPIFQNTKLPKLGCDWSGGFKIPEFSLDKFLAENNIIGSVQGLLLDQLMEALGITPYLKDTPCNRHLPPFSSAQSDGWNNGMI